MNDSKPIQVSSNAFITDSNFDPILFTFAQAKQWAENYRKQLQKQMKCRLKLKGIRDCGRYWTFTIG